MGPVQKLIRDRSGAVAMIMALATPVFIGALGLSVDTIQWTLTKRQMQRQADSGALAGAYGLAQNLSPKSVVLNDLARNSYVTLTEAPLIENAPTAGIAAGNARAVRVLLRTRVDLPFSGFVMGGSLLIPAESTASLVSNGDYCALSLERENFTGINMTGNATVDLRCGMATNSVSADAVSAGGSSQVTATPISAVGGLQPSTNYTGTTQLIPFATPQPDPYGGLPDPSGFGSPKNGKVGTKGNAQLDPGTYKSLDIQGKATLKPGVYIIDGGDFSLGAQADVTGTGVTIILTSQTAAGNPNSIGQVKINGGATLNLTASETGTYAGILFYQDRRAPMVNQSNKINGNSTSKLQGAIYFPGQEVEFTGTTGMNIDCVQLVARRLTFTGNSTVRNICPAGSGAQAFKGTAVRLVG